MARITQHYKIEGDAPFLDIEADQDNRLFVDPHAVRVAGDPQPFTAAAITAMDTFFQSVASTVMSKDPIVRRHGMVLLQQFKEPYETRLGMSRTGFHGHGGAEDIGKLIWQAMDEDLEALVELGLLRNLEMLPMFVENVDKDLTSDITTRIIYGPLADFTRAMIERYPEFTAEHHRTQAVQRQVWDTELLEWRIANLELPIVDGRPLLLVPKYWARSTLLMSASRFYDKSVLDYAQLEQAVRLPDGKLAKTPKDRLRKQTDLTPGRLTILKITLRAYGHGEDLIGRFEQYVNSKLPPRNSAA